MQWIKCSSHIPAPMQEVLCYFTFGIKIGRHCGYTPICWIDDNGYEIQNVTHWMPLPPSPKD